MSTSGGISGGGVALIPTYNGTTTPEGNQVGNVGETYLDTTHGALYFKNSGAGNTGWVMGAGKGINSAFNGIGFGSSGILIVTALGTNGKGIQIADALAVAGTGNGIYYNCTGVDGAQSVTVFLGTSSQFSTNFNADGSTNLPGPVTTKPTDSHTATAAFGALTLGTPKRNTLGYDIMVNVSIPVSAAAGGSFVAGVGSSATPTTDAATPAIAVVETANLTFVVPNGYYLTVDKTGTITAGTPVLIVTPL